MDKKRNPVLAHSRRLRSRRGAVTVEFAIVAPVILSIVVGVAETSQLLEIRNQMATSLRDGVRIVAMDREGHAAMSSSMNDKVATDVKQYLASHGVDIDDIAVRIEGYDPYTPAFDLDDPQNNLKLFKTTVEVAPDDEGLFVTGSGQAMTASIVFRNGKAAIVQ